MGSGEEIPSSMETVPTDCLDGLSSGDEPDAWGRLLPNGSSFSSFDLINDNYTFGRGEMCDYQFTNVRDNPCFLAYSKIHFKLSREQTSTGQYVFLTDLSSNGTFVNSVLVGRGNKQVLNNYDEISLALGKSKAFIFLDISVSPSIPQEVQEKLTLTKVLGRGAYGEVKLGFCKGTCRKVAVKILQKKQLSFQSNGDNEQLMNEVNILKKLQHPCIISVEDVIDTTEQLYIVLELVEGGELFDRVESGKFDEPTAKLYSYQMIRGIQYLHSQGVTHRDLKPENILLLTDDPETTIKISDFGLSKFVDNETMLKTFCGTPNYVAPEILKNQGSYTQAVDVWSLGVIVFICLVGYPPFSDDRKDMELFKQIIGGHYELTHEYWKDISEQAKNLIRGMLEVNPSKRFTIDQCADHPWFKEDEEIRMKAEALMTNNNDKKRKLLETGTDQPNKKRA